MDLRFVVNTLAPDKLTRVLLSQMPKDGRITTLSSAAHAPVELKALEGRHQRALDDMSASAESKRALTLWSMALAEALQEGPSAIAVNHVSLRASKMVKDGFGVAGHDLQIGVDILCRLALDPVFEGETGRYWDNDAGHFAPVDTSQKAALMEVINRLV